ncbi:endonuclease domain-containing protein [Sphingomonas floccifaciens]|uniref:Endonuclease domain-containing protein n=2 Tax=Sphingomonas floccifaciens TaxID=1844115 RepID=A0ABW4NBU7_9SPHN
MTLPEVQLWQQLRGSPQGVSFRRQHPIGPYVVDFFCPKASLVIEIDGISRDMANRPARDALRDAFLADNGYRVLRIAAARILADPTGTAEAIVSRAARPLHQPAAGPPPRVGED